MSVVLEEVVPWGRTLDEYRLLFDLSDDDIRSRIIGCGDGPASFNAEMSELGYRVTSFDPIYSLSKTDIEGRIAQTYPAIIDQCKTSLHNFVWSYFSDPDDLGRHRLAAMNRFLADFETGLSERRYVAESFPALSFATGEFDLALCSHLLFLYSDQLSLEFHVAAIREMCRVAHEARIFPLLDLNCRVSRHVDPVVSQLRSEGYEVELESVPYEFQRGGNQMMKIVGR
jgi:SAM-dependent methyltransferase